MNQNNWKFNLWPLKLATCFPFTYTNLLVQVTFDLWIFECLKPLYVWNESKHIYETSTYIFLLNQATFCNLPLLLNQNTDICLIFFIFARIQRKIRKRKQSAEAYWNFAHKSLLWARFRDFFMFIMGEVAWLALNKFCCYLDTQCLDLISIVNPFSGFINHPNRDIVWTKLV